MPRVDIAQLPAPEVELRIEERRVAVGRRRPVQEPVHLCRQLRRGEVTLGRDHPQRRLHRRHEQRRRDPFAGDIRHRDADSLVCQIEEVVIVAAHGPRRQREAAKAAAAQRAAAAAEGASAPPLPAPGPAVASPAPAPARSAARSRSAAQRRPPRCSIVASPRP